MDHSSLRPPPVSAISCTRGHLCIIPSVYIAASPYGIRSLPDRNSSPNEPMGNETLGYLWVHTLQRIVHSFVDVLEALSYPLPAGSSSRNESKQVDPFIQRGKLARHTRPRTPSKLSTCPNNPNHPTRLHLPTSSLQLLVDPQSLTLPSLLRLYPIYPVGQLPLNPALSPLPFDHHLPIPDRYLLVLLPKHLLKVLAAR